MFDYSLNFEAVDRASSGIAAINRKVKNLQQSAERTSAKLRGMGTTMVAASAGMLGALALPLNAARKYELAFKDVRKSVDGTPEQLDALRQSMKSFVGASFGDVSSVVSEAGKMGLAADKVMAFSENVIKGSRALDFSAETAVEQVGQILSMTNQLGTATASSLDIMEKAAFLENSLSNVKAKGVLDIWARSSDLFHQLSFDNKKMAGMSAFLEQTSVSSELGASGFKSMINKFKEFDHELGFFTRIKEGGMEGLKDVIGEFDKMSPEQLKSFGSEALTLIDKLRNSANMEKLDFAIATSGASAGAVDAEWDIYASTFDFRLNEFKKSIANLSDDVGAPMLAIATQILNAIKPIISSVGAWVKQNKGLVVAIGKVTGVVGAALLVLGTLSLVASAVVGGMGALSAISLLVTGKFGLMAAATWILNTAFWANPITWIVAGFVALAAAVVGVIVYWDELSLLVTGLWEKFSFFGTVSTIFSGLGSVILGLTYPMRTLLGYISEATLGFNAVTNGMQAVSGFLFGDDENKSGGSWSNVGEGSSKMENVNSNRSVLDVNITSSDGLQADTKAKSTGGVNLRTASNGISQ